MNQMPGALERLRFAVDMLPGVLAQFSEAESEQRSSPERWTKKEIVGHLIDSASNNHQRFVRGQIASRQDFPGYEQEKWVRLQNYQAARWADLIDLWRAFNLHLLHVAGHMSEEGRRATCRIGGGSEVNLAGLFVDYVDHMEHHLRKMLGRWENDHRPLESPGPLRGKITAVQKVNLGEKLGLFSDPWTPKVVGELNSQQVKLVKFQGPFVWHHHDHEDELFLVVKGQFRMEFRDRHVWLEEGEFLVVPRGVEHRPVADEEAHVLLFEPASTLNTGNVRNERTVAQLDRI
jgi:mannose-6-phosphate isomerase-like protein (cupin superfamily)